MDPQSDVGKKDNTNGAGPTNKLAPTPNHSLSQLSAWLPPEKPRPCPHVESWMAEKDWELSYATVWSKK